MKKAIISNLTSVIFLIFLFTFAISFYYPDSFFIATSNNVVLLLILFALFILNVVLKKDTEFKGISYIVSLAVFLGISTILNVLEPNVNSPVSFDSIVYWVLLGALVIKTILQLKLIKKNRGVV
ncbi:hypothetical protein LCL89_05645 [Halobacillus yeomjeoni]|uniref:hypothetical protein n=1 Tax=Halobacillus yeomjeoni TaxID=311194 RepID=UPI001CD60656|nr:hypothetical protein [Halobacillus yeomjeoni]MCA0983536.1 hypothetical protein [Halobacillus yeomjeoni]